MMWRRLLIGLMLLWGVQENLFSLKYEPSLEKVVDPVLSLPEGKELVNRVESQSAVSVRFGQEGETVSEAYWQASSREIVLIPNRGRRSCGSLIRSLVVELYNAASDERLMQLRRQAVEGKFTMAAYVEAVERVEYASCLSAAALINTGIARGIFPVDTRLHVASSFKQHYQTQWNSGHSGRIARSYLRLRRV